jgi:hypothetical protein
VLVAGEEGHRATALGRADLRSCGWMGFGGARSRPRLVRRGSGSVEGVREMSRGSGPGSRGEGAGGAAAERERAAETQGRVGW